MTEILTFDPRGGATDTQIQQQNWQRIGLAMSLLENCDLDACIETFELAHAIGPFLDPTAYRDALVRGDAQDMEQLIRSLREPVRIWREKLADKAKAAAL